MQIFEFVPENTSECWVTAWLHIDAEGNGEKRPCIVICPGGAYGGVSDREGTPVAQAYFDAGYQAFVLQYSVLEKAKDFIPLIQLACAVAHIRSNADAWGIAADQIAVCGFSAGGHLAGSLGTMFNESKFLERFQQAAHIRPDAVVLCYPVILADEFAHENSIRRVSGAEPGEEAYQWFGLDARVDAQTPPTFLWHTARDKTVPVENSLKMAAALSAAKVPFELHVFPEGPHGMSICTEAVGSKSDYNARWVDWSIRWLNKIFKIEHEA